MRKWPVGMRFYRRQASQHIVGRTFAVVIKPFLIREFGRAINADAYGNRVFCQDIAPFLIQQRAIGLHQEFDGQGCAGGANPLNDFNKPRFSDEHGFAAVKLDNKFINAVLRAVFHNKFANTINDIVAHLFGSRFPAVISAIVNVAIRTIEITALVNL
nr:hypothetical protein [uncultured Tateyamaria sp.]